MIFDFFIVGQGIAGSTLAWHLWEEGVNFKVFNVTKKESSSMVAAGLYNPVTGRKMVKTWNADLLFPYLESFYQRIEQKTNQSFLYPKPIYRPFVSVEEQNDWLAKADNKAFAAYVEKIATSSLFPGVLNDPWGGILLKSSGYLDVPAYLKASQAFFNRQQVYQEVSFGWQDLRITKDKDYAEIGGQKARHLIFCEGPEAIKNPFFHWLPFHLVKGEILYIKPEERQEVVFNRGIFILPVGEECKVGSTYDHHDLSYQTTSEGRTFLEEKIQKLCKLRYQVSGQIAGIRPATQDRKPFIGIHPEHKPLGIFNGLGTKGVSLAPYYAKQFTLRLLEGQFLDTEVDIQRFNHLYNSVLT
ncbi:NAD(P)/FAD-dependent oxidoreductase [Catalinimonas niigatensis]|uniref:NAD(P)/FAD-dependent oxidoreductase n=1 Tax=Catalinimonas niigatensis TaxID=1397264 RepID=UPI00266706CF|nr:FAD-dependent oxidoreductase [Catalinimonas niigatensis]WPP49875.1 FAD-dependent oxidoreductase [Catalinimonas niigatensis]